MKILGTTPEHLAKFCPPEFNIKTGCNTVRFGTLYDYRTEENEKLRDEHEGTFNYIIEFPQLTKVSAAWLASFEIDGESMCNIEKMELKTDGIYIKKIDFSGSCHNCWIYCISKNNEKAGNITETHQDKWLIPVEKLQTLANYLGSLLWSDLKPKDLPHRLSEMYSLTEIQQRLSLSIEISEVQYTHREILIKNEADLPIPDIQALKNKIAFIKPKLFEPEQEVRIAFWLCFDGKKISIANLPKIVELRPIDKIV